MTKKELRDLVPEDDAERHAQYVISIWEARFPDALTDERRLILFSFMSCVPQPPTVYGIRRPSIKGLKKE